MSDRTADEDGLALTALRDDAMAECPLCDMPLMPSDVEGDLVVLECANRHRAMAPFPAETAARRLVEHRIAVRGAQVHAQRERWALEAEADEGADA